MVGSLTFAFLSWVTLQKWWWCFRVCKDRVRWCDDDFIPFSGESSILSTNLDGGGGSGSLGTILVILTYNCMWIKDLELQFTDTVRWTGLVNSFTLPASRLLLLDTASLKWLCWAELPFHCLTVFYGHLRRRVFSEMWMVGLWLCSLPYKQGDLSAPGLTLFYITGSTVFVLQTKTFVGWSFFSKSAASLLQLLMKPANVLTVSEAEDLEVAVKFFTSALILV